MSELSKSDPRSHTIRWPGGDWERIEDAAQRLGEREHIEITPTDIIRSGAIRRAEEILATEQEAA